MPITQIFANQLYTQTYTKPTEKKTPPPSNPPVRFPQFCLPGLVVRQQTSFLFF